MFTQTCNSLFYNAATTPAMAMTAAAKLPTCLLSAAALPVPEAPAAVLVADEWDAEARPVAVAGGLDAVVTIVVVQLHSEL